MTFAVPGPGPYALTHSVGCLPESASGVLDARYLRPWRESGGDAWPEWLAVIDHFRSSLAALLGGRSDEYCPQANLSGGLAKIVASLPDAPDGRRKIVAAEEGFPSISYALERHAVTRGRDFVLLPRSASPAELQTWADAIDDQTAFVLVTHVHSTTGTVAPVEAIARLCRERGAVCVVDVAQSAGVLPIDVAFWGAHAVIGSCVKWLFGGPGAGFLWIDPRWLPLLEPPDVGWFSHLDPFAFDPHVFTYASDARRFWGGTPSVAPYALALEGLRVLEERGSDAVRQHNLRSPFDSTRATTSFGCRSTYTTRPLKRAPSPVPGAGADAVSVFLRSPSRSRAA